MSRWLIGLAGLAGALAVGCDALGAHFLKMRLEPAALAAYDTGVDYLLIHAAALAGIGAALQAGAPLRGLPLAGGVMMVGMVLFCGTLIAAPLLHAEILHRATPAGGLALMAGWLILLAAAVAGGRRTDTQEEGI